MKRGGAINLSLHGCLNQGCRQRGQISDSLLSLRFLLYRLGISLLECLCLKFCSLWYSSLHCLVWETSECILGVVICILEVGQYQELPLFFQVIQWKFCGKTGNYLLLNRQKIVTMLFSVLNYVAKLHILTIVFFFKFSSPSFTMV